MADPSRLYGLKALVINAAGGIGEASARTLMKHGASVLAVDTINSGMRAAFQVRERYRRDCCEPDRRDAYAGAG